MAGIDRRRALQVFGAVGAAGLVAACGTNEAPEIGQRRSSPVRIGLLVPASGGYQAIGDEIRNGFRRYLGGTDGRLGGHPVTELEEDEGESGEDAVAALERLLEQDVHAVVGVAGSEALLALTGLIEEAHVPLVSASASPQQLTGVPYIWRTSYVDHEPGLALGRHLVSAVGGPVAVVAQDSTMGTDALAGLQEAFAAEQAEDQLGEPILTPPQRQPEEGFFADVLAQVQLRDPDAVFAAYAGAAANAFLTEYLAAGLDPGRLYAPGTLTEGTVLGELGEQAVGIHTAANYAPELRGAANRSFAVGYRAEHGPPTVYAVAAYDAAAVLDTAIRLTDGDPDPRRVNLTLGEVGLVDSPRGRWQFNQNRTPTQKWYLRQVAPDGPVVGNMVIQELGTLG